MQQQIQNNSSEQYHSYHPGILIALIALYAICLVTLVVSTSMVGDIASLNSPFNMALVGLLVEAIFVMVIDRHGALTLRGAVKGQTMHQGKMVNTVPAYVILYILLPYIMLAIYLIRVVSNYRKEKQEQQRKHQVASLEAQLGILPATEGECRVCHKPLVVGSEFCQYCGTPTIESPKICPVCATTALPDAKFCPKCRAALP